MSLPLFLKLLLLGIFLTCNAFQQADNFFWGILERNGRFCYPSEISCSKTGQFCLCIIMWTGLNDFLSCIITFYHLGKLTRCGWNDYNRNEHNVFNHETKSKLLQSMAGFPSLYPFRINVINPHLRPWKRPDPLIQKWGMYI